MIEADLVILPYDRVDNTGQRGEEMRTIGVQSLTAIERINTVAHLKRDSVLISLSKNSRIAPAGNPI